MDPHAAMKPYRTEIILTTWSAAICIILTTGIAMIMAR
jgi:hypothetical protein